MLVSLNWLNQYVDIESFKPEDIAERITKTGIEVDGIHYTGSNTDGIVTGLVKSCEKHPHADNLSVCQVEVDDSVLQIVCGALNVRQGQKVAVAKPGAHLPNNMEIKALDMRGVESNGMICSLQELGFDDKYIPDAAADGIYVFPENVQIGEPVEQLLNLNDAVLEFDLTPNRSDALSMLGVAYETAAILDKEVMWPAENIQKKAGNSGHSLSVQVENPELNPYYGAFIAKDITIDASPLWMQNALIASGIRPINNVVDITNYVLLEYGQPLHAFDFDRFGSSEVVTRRAYDQEKIKTLDGETHTLTSNHLVITNGKEPVALAGVMGGADTEIQEDTTAILLEAAYFDPVSVRTTANETGLHSDSSTRFEKGVDPNRVERAGWRVCHLLERYAGATILDGPVSFDQLDRREQTITMTTDHINKRLGTNIRSHEISHILQKLQFSFEKKDNHFVVNIPTRRGDISIFEDMLEEVARLYGYDHLPYTLPEGATQAGGLTNKQKLQREVNNYMQSAGLMEAITYALTDETMIDKLISPDVSEKNPYPVQLAMPMSKDHEYLRLSILPELLRDLSYNKARSETNLHYYELGNVFISDEPSLTHQPEEPLRLTGALTGMWLNHPWQEETKPVDFYVIKGIIEGLFNFLDMPITFHQYQLEHMHPGRCALITMHDKPIGFMGQIHPTFAKTMELNETYVFDLAMDEILEQYESKTHYEPISKYPSVERDAAFVVDESVQAGDIKKMIYKEGSPLVKNVQIFDVYRGEHLPDGKKSLAYNLLYQNHERTLQDNEVEASYQSIIDRVNQAFNAYTRS